MYFIIVCLSLPFIVIPILGWILNSVKVATFMFSFGYASLFNQDESKVKRIGHDEYLRKTCLIQCTFGACCILYAIIYSLLQVPSDIGISFFVPVACIGNFIAMTLFKRYKLQ